MSSLLIIFVSGIAFFLAYRFYASKAERIFNIDPRRATPAYAKFDSVDYIPAKNWLVLFGHHFSSIAGAGPIIGPVIAVTLWGWMPALLWVVLGTIFIGGIHDFGALVSSIREGGVSVADIASRTISRRAKIIFSLFVWCALILVIAVFIYLCADTFIKQPQIVLPSLGIIPIAILLGYLMYYVRVNSVLVTVLGLLFLALLLRYGDMFIIKTDIKVWIVILFVYCYFASVLPVNILLQPRDYLCSFLLFFSVGVGYIGLFLSKPKIIAPAFGAFSSVEGPLWPMLFVTVACGAVSGFHSLIASGTTSKQIASERHAKRIGYGSMIAEGAVAVLAIVCAAAIFGLQDNPGALLKKMTPTGIFAQGFGTVSSSILGSSGAFIAITILNAFILTTLDTATRISRYLTEELTGIKNRYLSTMLIVFLGLVLALSGKWQKIWPVFGASNQLVAALALFIVACWLIAKNKPIKFILWPAFFMLITSVCALFLQAIHSFNNKDITLGVISLILVILAGFMVYEVLPVIFTRRRKYV
ncbi:MAG: carbon starvation protein A [Candidatus Omnitrophica bacterium]|nr:carbon starvation protein A [Candidatus Omnitrophota bacterium]